jgi:hypothetical protein
VWYSSQENGHLVHRKQYFSETAHAFRESKEATLFGFPESVRLFHFHLMPFDDILIL